MNEKILMILSSKEYLIVVLIVFAFSVVLYGRKHFDDLLKPIGPCYLLGLALLDLALSSAPKDIHNLVMSIALFIMSFVLWMAV